MIDTTHQQYCPLYLAPMDGISDPTFRQVVMDRYGQNGWDYVVTEFLRVPTHATYKSSFIQEFIGEQFRPGTPYFAKTIVQILATEQSSITQTVKQIEELGFSWIDLNLGCPSSTVNRHKGGAYLLTDPLALKKMVNLIRKSFSGRFSIKMRVGYATDEGLAELLHILTEEGVDQITLHARTREDQYKNPANWNYLTRAKSLTSLPLIGNGDVWIPEDIKSMKEQTGVDGVMIGRGAFRTPWLAQFFKEGRASLSMNDHLKEFYLFLQQLKEIYISMDKRETFVLSRFKALSLYLFTTHPRGEELKKELLRQNSLLGFESHLLLLDT